MYTFLHFPQSFFTAYCLYFHFFNYLLIFYFEEYKDRDVTKFVTGRFYKGLFPARDFFPELSDDSEIKQGV